MLGYRAGVVGDGGQRKSLEAGVLAGSLYVVGMDRIGMVFGRGSEYECCSSGARCP